MPSNLGPFRAATGLPVALIRFLATFALLVAAGLAAEEPPFQDNSFLLEEAYNQEEGTVQHTLVFERMRGGEWIASFEQEWPVPREKHQLSYAIPYQRVDFDSGKRTGIGDVQLNYRYQLAGSAEARFACTPRLTLLLPTGDEEKGLGAGGAGIELNVAASTVLSDLFVTHSNLGVTHTPSARNARREKAATTGLDAGQSLIWTFRPNLHLMLEAIWSRAQVVTGPHRTEWQSEAFVSPGIRAAINLAGGLQIVPGLAFPIGVGPSSGDRSVLLYLSFEHFFRKVGGN
jgi:hypothetical protein